MDTTNLKIKIFDLLNELSNRGYHTELRFTDTRIEYSIFYKKISKNNIYDLELISHTIKSKNIKDIYERILYDVVRLPMDGGYYIK